MNLFYLPKLAYPLILFPNADDLSGLYKTYFLNEVFDFCEPNDDLDGDFDG
jgi:hypothetical protein